MNYVKVGGTLYPASVTGPAKDPSWLGRESKSITLTMTHGEAIALFVDGLAWSILQERGGFVNKDGQMVDLEPVEIDCSAYDVAGPVTDHRDGTVTVKMGKSTHAEVLNALVGVSGDMSRSAVRQLRTSIEAAAQALEGEAAAAAPGLFREMRFDGQLIKVGTKINWKGSVKKAAVDLWDLEVYNPDKAPTLWEVV